MSNLESYLDVIKGTTDIPLPIDLVGIKELRIPVCIKKDVQVPGIVNASVSLDDKDARGIHMSRIYLVLHEFFSKEVISFSSLKTILKKIISDQEGLSHSGKIELKMDWPIKRKALKSPLHGWRYYPFTLIVYFNEKENKFSCVFKSEVMYSSTCPCSASLSRQVIKDEFNKKFPSSYLDTKQISEWLESEDSLSATPHAQKSSALFKILLDENQCKDIPLIDFINQVEDVLGTPVQTAVKRQDEKAFAELNAKNLMFCEDAVRKIAHCFNKRKEIKDYFIKVRHYESLHPFTVESSKTKGVVGGWQV